jgi:two-component system chemotaxis response regulator CheY
MISPDKLLKKINILTVDDMEAIRSMIKAVLRNMGAQNIEVAIHGEAAWKMLNSKRIDMVICDWDMPKMTGIELLHKIRASEEHKHIPFLLLTATTEKERVIAAVKAGVTDYLSKPFQPKELEYRVLKMLAKVNLEHKS